MAGIWGTLACGLFTAPRLAEYNAVGDPGGLVYTGSFTQLGAQALGVVDRRSRSCSSSSLIAFWRHQDDVRLARHAEEEDAGLDISEHGMYGYPEQFIPAPELVGSGRRAAGPAAIAASVATEQEVPA